MSCVEIFGKQYETSNIPESLKKLFDIKAIRDAVDSGDVDLNTGFLNNQVFDEHYLWDVADKSISLSEIKYAYDEAKDMSQLDDVSRALLHVRFDKASIESGDGLDMSTSENPKLKSWWFTKGTGKGARFDTFVQELANTLHRDYDDIKADVIEKMMSGRGALSKNDLLKSLESRFKTVEKYYGIKDGIGKYSPLIDPRRRDSFYKSGIDAPSQAKLATSIAAKIFTGEESKADVLKSIYESLNPELSTHKNIIDQWHNILTQVEGKLLSWGSVDGNAYNTHSLEGRPSFIAKLLPDLLIPDRSHDYSISSVKDVMDPYVVQNLLFGALQDYDIKGIEDVISVLHGLNTSWASDLAANIQKSENKNLILSKVTAPSHFLATSDKGLYHASSTISDIYKNIVNRLNIFDKEELLKHINAKNVSYSNLLKILGIEVPNISIVQKQLKAALPAIRTFAETGNADNLVNDGKFKDLVGAIKKQTSIYNDPTAYIGGKSYSNRAKFNYVLSKVREGFNSKIPFIRNRFTPSTIGGLEAGYLSPRPMSGVDKAYHEMTPTERMICNLRLMYHTKDEIHVLSFNPDNTSFMYLKAGGRADISRDVLYDRMINSEVDNILDGKQSSILSMPELNAASIDKSSLIDVLNADTKNVNRDVLKSKIKDVIFEYFNKRIDAEVKSTKELISPVWSKIPRKEYTLDTMSEDYTLRKMLFNYEKHGFIYPELSSYEPKSIQDDVAVAKVQSKKDPSTFFSRVSDIFNSTFKSLEKRYKGVSSPTDKASCNSQSRALFVHDYDADGQQLISIAEAARVLQNQSKVSNVLAKEISNLTEGRKWSYESLISGLSDYDRINGTNILAEYNKLNWEPIKEMTFNENYIKSLSYVINPKNAQGTHLEHLMELMGTCNIGRIIPKSAAKMHQGEFYNIKTDDGFARNVSPDKIQTINIGGVQQESPRDKETTPKITQSYKNKFNNIKEFVYTGGGKAVKTTAAEGHKMLRDMVSNLNEMYLNKTLKSYGLVKVDGDIKVVDQDKFRNKLLNMGISYQYDNRTLDFIANGDLRTIPFAENPYGIQSIISSIIPNTVMKWEMPGNTLYEVSSSVLGKINGGFTLLKEPGFEMAKDECIVPMPKYLSDLPKEKRDKLLEELKKNPPTYTYNRNPNQSNAMSVALKVVAFDESDSKKIYLHPDIEKRTGSNKDGDMSYTHRKEMCVDGNKLIEAGSRTKPAWVDEKIINIAKYGDPISELYNKYEKIQENQELAEGHREEAERIRSHIKDVLSKYEESGYDFDTLKRIYRDYVPENDEMSEFKDSVGRLIDYIETKEGLAQFEESEALKIGGKSEKYMSFEAIEKGMQKNPIGTSRAAGSYAMDQWLKSFDPILKGKNDIVGLFQDVHNSHSDIQSIDNSSLINAGKKYKDGSYNNFLGPAYEESKIANNTDVGNGIPMFANALSTASILNDAGSGIEINLKKSVEIGDWRGDGRLGKSTGEDNVIKRLSDNLSSCLDAASKGVDGLGLQEPNFKVIEYLCYPNSEGEHLPIKDMLGFLNSKEVRFINEKIKEGLSESKAVEAAKKEYPNSKISDNWYNAFRLGSELENLHKFMNIASNGAGSDPVRIERMKKEWQNLEFRYKGVKEAFENSVISQDYHYGVELSSSLMSRYSNIYNADEALDRMSNYTICSGEQLGRHLDNALYENMIRLSISGFDDLRENSSAALEKLYGENKLSDDYFWRHVTAEYDGNQFKGLVVNKGIDLNFNLEMQKHIKKYASDIIDFALTHGETRSNKSLFAYIPREIKENNNRMLDFYSTIAENDYQSNSSYKSLEEDVAYFHPEILKDCSIDTYMKDGKPVIKESGLFKYGDYVKYGNESYKNNKGVLEKLEGRDGYISTESNPSYTVISKETISKEFGLKDGAKLSDVLNNMKSSKHLSDFEREYVGRLSEIGKFANVDVRFSDIPNIAEYKNGTMTINMSKVQDNPSEAIIHELTHAAINAYFETADNSEQIKGLVDKHRLNERFEQIKSLIGVDEDKLSETIESIKRGDKDVVNPELIPYTDPKEFFAYLASNADFRKEITDKAGRSESFKELVMENLTRAEDALGRDPLIADVLMRIYDVADIVGLGTDMSALSHAKTREQNFESVSNFLIGLDKNAEIKQGQIVIKSDNYADVVNFLAQANFDAGYSEGNTYRYYAVQDGKDIKVFEVKRQKYNELDVYTKQMMDVLKDC
ncbi:MAG: hypothetical protein HQK96_04315 [Nitrospirae bacterium]|nr:hypothetical protein [Nitrospirota bacterium]